MEKEGMGSEREGRSDVEIHQEEALPD